MSAEELLPNDIQPEDFAEFAAIVATGVDAAIKRGEEIELSNWDDVLLVVDQADDEEEPDTSEWPDRVQFQFRGQLVQWFNEFFEWRGAPSSPSNNGNGPSRVGSRLFAALSQTAWEARDDDVPVWEISNYRSGEDSRETIAGINKHGDLHLAGQITGDNLLGGWEDIELAEDINPGDEDYPPRARLEFGAIVRLAGLIDPETAQSAGATLATIPEDLWPPVPVLLSGRTGSLPELSAGNTIRIDTDGTITVPDSGVGGGGGVSLDGHTYPLD